MTNYFEDKRFLGELQEMTDILETHFKDMVDFEFTIENEKLYILEARRGRRTALANLRIAMNMFCESKIDLNECIRLLHPQELAELMDLKILINESELYFIGKGLPVSRGKMIEPCGVAVFTNVEAKKMIENNTRYILCLSDATPEDIGSIISPFCVGVITEREGMTSHAATLCQGACIPCVTGMFDAINIAYAKLIEYKTQYITFDANNGSVYIGQGIFENFNVTAQEIYYLYKLLLIGIKCNFWNEDVILNAWSLWDVVVNEKQYGKCDSMKQAASHLSDTYTSFTQPIASDMEELKSHLITMKNGEMLVGGLVKDLLRQLSKQVSIGEHYRYVRPLFDPAKTKQFIESDFCIESDVYVNKAGTQITGIEFHNINRFLDCYIDIKRIRIIFKTIFCFHQGEFFPLNFLDFTNPKGESIIINNYSAESIAIQVNDVWIDSSDILLFYHLFRRRLYHWTWYEDNHVTKQQIVDYLNAEVYLREQNSKLFYLCQEVNLLDGENLTTIGKSLIGDE